MSSDLFGLPWQSYEDVQVFVNEYIHPASINRGYRRLLENDKYIEATLTPREVNLGLQFIPSSKKLEITGEGGIKYYVDLKEIAQS